MMPPCRIQWVVRTPVDTRAVGITRTVLIEIRRTKLGLRIQAGRCVYITPPPVTRAVIHPWINVVCNLRMSIEDFKCLVDI